MIGKTPVTPEHLTCEDLPVTPEGPAPGSFLCHGKQEIHELYVM